MVELFRKNGKLGRKKFSLKFIINKINGLNLFNLQYVKYK